VSACSEILSDRSLVGYLFVETVSVVGPLERVLCVPSAVRRARLPRHACNRGMSHITHLNLYSDEEDLV